jgi:hypothetical protein
VFSIVAAISSVLSLLYALVTSDGTLVAPTLVASSITLIAMGLTRLSCKAGSRKKAACPPEFRMDRRFATFCLGAGVGILASLPISSLAAALFGIVVCLILLRVGTRRAAERPGLAGRGRIGKARVGVLALAAIIVTIFVFIGTAVAVVTSHDGGTGGTKKKREQENSVGGDGLVPPHPPAVESQPTYQDLCPRLPDPLRIGHGLGKLFEEADAVKAGCGTKAFSLPHTGDWVAAGMCVGERRSVAFSKPGMPPVITYGEASEFIWMAAQIGELTGVETASPAGGEVVLVETIHGSYGFARSKRSASPGNPNPQSCNEVGGVAEPFAELPPPLLVLWTELVQEEATWYWPTYDEDDETEAVAFISTDGVRQGECETVEHCTLEIGGKVEKRVGSEFTTIADLAEYMPAG